MMFGPSATARSAVTQPSVVSLQFSEVRHVLRQHFDPRDHVADLSMTVFSWNKTPPDILCLYGARALRSFGDGFAIIILPVYLSAIGFSPQLIGIVASASLLGTAALTLIVGFIAPRFELRPSRRFCLSPSSEASIHREAIWACWFPLSMRC
jgi:hypothetical protein